MDNVIEEAWTVSCGLPNFAVIVNQIGFCKETSVLTIIVYALIWILLDICDNKAAGVLYNLL